MADRTTENGFMPLQWVKSNWTIISLLGAMTYGGIIAWDDQKDETRDIKVDVSDIKDQLTDMRSNTKDRQKVADEFYRAQTDLNLPMRVKALEEEQLEMRELFRQFQIGQAAQFEALKDGFSDLKTEIRVVSSKVDDLRSQRPQKTTFIK